MTNNVSFLLAGMLAASTSAAGSDAAAPSAAAPGRNVVLVRGAFVEAAGWRGVYDELM